MPRLDASATGEARGDHTQSAGWARVDPNGALDDLLVPSFRAGLVWPDGRRPRLASWASSMLCVPATTMMVAYPMFADDSGSDRDCDDDCGGRCEP